MPVEFVRPKFLVALLDEVDAFDAPYSPRDPVEKGETPRGTLTPWLQRAYALSRYYYKQSRLLVVEREYGEQDAAGDSEIAEMKYKCDLLMEILWACARAELGLWSQNSVGVRENFTIIGSESKEDDDGFKKMLMAIFKKG